MVVAPHGPPLEAPLMYHKHYLLRYCCSNAVVLNLGHPFKVR